MKLKSLKIKGFKNLSGPDGWFEIDFEKTEGITVLVGNNGSGKSNVLEAVSGIFSSLYRKVPFEYDYWIKYEKDGRNIEAGETNKQIHFQKTATKEESGSPFTDFHPFLPSQIIAGYSGEETRLYAEYFEPEEKRFKSQIKKTTNSSFKNSFLYIDKKDWIKAFLTLAIYQMEELQKIVAVEKINSIKIEFNQKKFQEYEKNPNPISAFVEKLNPSLESSKIFKIQDIKEIVYTFLDIGGGNHLLIDNAGNKLILEENINRKEFYQSLFLAEKIGFIKNIEIIFNENLTISSLSEGQKKLILVKLILEVLADENSLILLDEPDSHIHVGKKDSLKKMMDEYSNREIILTTHSPTLMHCFDEKHLKYLEGGEVSKEEQTKRENFRKISDGKMSYTQEHIFFNSDEEIILFVEGKHDKIHINTAFNHLKNEYPTLSFDIFQMNGESNIRNMLLGMLAHESDFKNKKIIGIWDNDEAGRNAMRQNFKNTPEKNYQCLVDKNGEQSSQLFGLLLPKKNDTNTTIENMYTGDKFKNSLRKVFEKRNDSTFFENSIDDISKQIREDAKNDLAEACKKFPPEDFEGFRVLFDLILDIKKL